MVESIMGLKFQDSNLAFSKPAEISAMEKRCSQVPCWCGELPRLANLPLPATHQVPLKHFQHALSILVIPPAKLSTC